jgi:hypothetical protein
MQHQGERAKTGWLESRIMCPSRATCLPADISFSELTQKNLIKRVFLVQRGHNYHLIECILFPPRYGWKTAPLALNNNHLSKGSRTLVLACWSMAIECNVILWYILHHTTNLREHLLCHSNLVPGSPTVRA